MTKSWQVLPIGEVCQVINGGTPKTGTREYWDGEHLWITPAEMGKRPSPYVSDTERRISDAGLANSSAQLLPPLSVILSSRAPIGHLVINTKPMATNQGCKSLIPDARLNHKFLYHYLSSIVDVLNSLGTGATFKELSAGKLKEVRVPVPPLPEQQRIVAILDEAFAGITTAKSNAEKNLQNARGIFDSQLQAIFNYCGKGWEQTTLGVVSDFKNGLNFTRESRGKKVRFVGVGDFQELSVVPVDSLQTVTMDGEIDDDYLIREDDLLIVRSNGSRHLVGRCMLVPELSQPTSFSGFIIRLRVDERKVFAPFLLQFMKTRKTRDRLTRDGGGANISNINQAKLAQLPLSLPSIAEQRAISRRLEDLSENCSSLGAIYVRKLAALAALKRSVLHRAFAGELTVTNTTKLVEAVA